MEYPRGACFGGIVWGKWVKTPVLWGFVPRGFLDKNVGENTPGKDGFWVMAERSFLQRLKYLYQDLYLGRGFDFTDESKAVLLKMVSFVQSGFM